MAGGAGLRLGGLTLSALGLVGLGLSALGLVALGLVGRGPFFARAGHHRRLALPAPTAPAAEVLPPGPDDPLLTSTIRISPAGPADQAGRADQAGPAARGAGAAPPEAVEYG